jgi:thiamine-monophosphate kinase
MGAEPRWGLIDIVAPADTPVQMLDELYEGAMKLATAHEFAVVGGDMAEGPVLEIHAFGLGSVPAGKALLRSGARPGNVLFVTGELGGSIMGRHLAVQPRIKEGIWLREWATAMIDVSDGLASDLRHMTTQSRIGCDLNASAIPVSPAVNEMVDSRSPMEHALHDGEDFELLFTVPEDREDSFMVAWQKAFSVSCTRIGMMTAEVGLVQCVFPDGESFALEGTGYTHFGG